MSAKVNPTSAAEPNNIKMSGKTPSATPVGSQKLSMFAAKSGFVIPKNKLSGSLVPIFRGTKKSGGAEAAIEESTKQMQRKTKWGPDLTQDPSVRRGRALAFQVRVDQITQQLNSRMFEVGDTEDSLLAAENPDHNWSSSQVDSKRSEMLELEKREAIGEIIKLNPSYKAPPGFKPVLKEAKVPLPVKEYPGYNFIGLILGPESDNQKRLEKETGTKIQVHGTKAETRDKGEIKPSDVSDMQSSYEELYVHISADTFEKVDAAVSIIELLITSITGNFAAVSTASTSASGDSINIPTHNLDGTTSYAVPVAVDNHGLVPPVAEPTQTHQGQLQYSGPGFSTISSHTPMVAPSGNITSPNPSAPVLNFSSQTVNPPNMPSLFGPRPPLVPAFSSTIQNPPVVPLGPQPLRQVLQQSHMAQTNPSGHIGPPRNPLIIGLQHSLTHTNIATASIPQPPPVGSRQTLVPQPMYGFPPAPIPQRSLNPAEISSAQSGAFANAGQMAPLMVPPHRPHFQYPQTDVVSTPPPNISSIGTQHASAPTHQAGLSPGLPASSGPMRLPATNLSVNHLSGPISIPPHGLSTSHPPPQHSGLHSSISGSSPYYSPIKPPMLTVSGSGNFTFQPHRPNSASQMVSRPSSQLVPPTAPQEHLSGPRPSTFQIGIPDRPLNQFFTRPPVHNWVDQPKAHISPIPFGGNSSAISCPPRQAAFPYGSQPSPRNPVPQMGPRNFNPAPQTLNFLSPNTPRAGNTLHLQQNYPTHTTRPDILLLPNQQSGNSHSSASAKPAYPGEQSYDPFSPTSVVHTEADR